MLIVAAFAAPLLMPTSIAAQELPDDDPIFIIHHPPRPPISETIAAIQVISESILVQGQPLPAPIGDAAYSVITIDRSRILGTASGRVEDVLKDIAGLTQFRRSDARSANATSQGATLRGLGGNASSRALLVLDGVPQSDPFGGWITWPAFAPDRIANIRVTRGGGSGALGPGALAGTIEFESVAGASSANLAYGSRNAIDANAMLGGKLGRGQGFISASYARGDGFIPIVTGQRGPADRPSPYEQASFAARGIAPLSDSTELQASILAFTDRRERGTILSGNGGHGADASIRVVHRARWDWSALAYLQARKFQSRFVSIDAARATVSQTVNQHNVPSTGIGARFEVRPPVGRTFELRIGGDWRRTTGETNEHFTYVASLPTRGREAGGQSDTLGAFAEASAEVGDMTLTTGGRADRWWIRSGHLTERTLPTGVLIRNEIAPDRQGWEPTGRAGLAYKAGKFTLRGAAYLGWRLPTLNELYRPFRVGADATAANPALSPERSRGVELGLSWTHQGSNERRGDVLHAPSTLNLSSTLFANRLSNAIGNVSLASGPGSFPGVGFVVAGGSYRQRQNLDAVRSRGLELDAAWTGGDWRAQASYALTDAKVRSSGAAIALSGLRPAQVPKHSASATLGWKRFGMTARYVSGQFEDDLNTRRLADALTFDAAAALRVGQKLELFARAENLANARVETAISATGVIERATPRTFWVGVRVRPF